MTCGFETTLLILAHMFKIDILVLRQDFVWISSKVAPIMCPVVLVQDETGFFLGTRTNFPIHVGSVPVVTVPYSIMNEGLFATSTPARTSNRPTNTVFSCALSPINSDSTVRTTNQNVGNKRRKKSTDNRVKTEKTSKRKSQPVWTAVRNQEMYKEGRTDTSTTSEETKILRQQIKKIEEDTLDTTETNSQLSTTIDPNEEKKCDDLSMTIDPNEEKKCDDLSTTIDPNEEKKCDDLSTTIDANEMVNHDDAQRTDISSNEVSAVTNDTDKSCTEVQSTTVEDKEGGCVQNEAEGSDLKKNTEIEMTDTEQNEGILESLESQLDNKNEKNMDIMSKSKNSDNSSKSLFSDPSEDTNHTSKNSDKHDSPPKPKKKRLGMMGPAFTKEKLSVNLSDVLLELNIPKDQSVIETGTCDGKQVVRKYMCKKCPEMFFTKSGYERHLLKVHKIRNVAEYEPEIIEKTIQIFGPHSYETTYKKVDKIEGAKKVKLVEYSCDDENDGSTRENNEIEEDDRSANIEEGVEGNEIQAGPFTITIPPVRDGTNDRGKTVHCTLCTETFYYESGLRTHIAHAHREKEDDDNELHVEKLKRQQEVLSTIPKKKPNKRSSTKKEGSNNKKSKNSDSRCPLTRQKYREIQTEISTQLYETEEKTEKKKYDLRNNNQDINDDDSMSLNQAMTIIDKHKTVKKGQRKEGAGKSVDTDRTDNNAESKEVSVMKKMTQNKDIVQETRMRTRSSDGKKTISETLDEIFEDETSNKSNDLDKKNRTQKVEKKKDEKEITPDTNNNAEDEEAENFSELQKSPKKKKDKQKKSSRHTNDEKKKPDSETTKPNTRSKTSRSKDSDICDVDRTVTDDNSAHIQSDTAENEGTQNEPDLPKGRRKTRKRKQKSSTGGEGEIEDGEKDVSGDKEVEDIFHCHICKKTFVNYNNFCAHRIKCWATGKKHQCPKCGKGFDARTLMQQHYDYRHTNKPKRFVCGTCKKSYELKKSLDEHNMRLHSKGSYKFQCDYCGRGFFHLNEFKMHRAGHTKIKEYLCGRCKVMAFSSVGKLNAHLKICGRPNSYECTICGKFYSSSSNLAIHVSDVHQKEVTWRCPVCDNKVYSSKGGYHRHLRDKHQIGRNGEKLTPEKIKELRDADNNEDKGSETGE